MKRFITLITVISLIFATMSTSYSAKPTTDTLRVGLYFGTTAKSSYNIASESGFSVGTEQDRQYTEAYKMADTVLTVTLEGNTIKFGDQTFDTSVGAILAFKPGGDSSMSIDGKKYRGGITFPLAGDGKLNAINLVLADEYVYGVTGLEMSASWPLEALKAQSVCARNYALTNLNKHKANGFDVCTNTDCQVYGGIDAEHTYTIKAGMETAGKYLMYNGNLTETLFFSCSGGHTSNAKYVWGSSIPYLTGVADPYENPNEVARYNWTKTYTIDEIQARLTATGVNIGAVTDIRTTIEPTTGQVIELEIIGTSGTQKDTNDKTRTWMGWDKLYSQRYTVTPVTGQTSQIMAYSAEGMEAAQGYTAISGKGTTSVANIPVSVISSKGTSAIEADITAFQFDGHGWGHGVGMSQYGAKGMADQGFTYDRILAFYYPGTYLE